MQPNTQSGRSLDSLGDWVRGALILVAGVLIVGVFGSWLASIGETALFLIMRSPARELPAWALGAVLFLVADVAPLLIAGLLTWLSWKWRGRRIATIVGIWLFSALLLAQRLAVVHIGLIPFAADSVRTALFVVTLVVVWVRFGPSLSGR